jgi:hypothetical protein
MRVERHGSFDEKNGLLDQGYLAASVQELCREFTCACTFYRSFLLCTYAWWCVTAHACLVMCDTVIWCYGAQELTALTSFILPMAVCFIMHT